MNVSMRVAALLSLAIVFAGCNVGSSLNVPGVARQLGEPSQALSLEASGYRRVCSDTRPGYMNCDALIATNPNPAVAGLTPADLQAAYQLPSKTRGAGQIVAIVDAYNNPNAASDLREYRKRFGLGTAKFTKYNELGQTKNYPAQCSGSNAGWCLEIDLDAQMVSAACPKCTIWLFEAKTNNTNDLYAAVARAAKMGAHIVSNSYGGGGGAASRGDFAKSGVTYLASAGDFGYGMQDPADYDSVVSVGGTVLSKAGAKYSEEVWPFSGGGCSVVAKPTWQHDPTCAKRTGNDVSAVASDVAEYDTFGYSGWITVGGTSVGSPLLGGVYALAGNAEMRQGGRVIWTLSKVDRAKYLRAIAKGQVTACPRSLRRTYLRKAGTGQYATYSGPAGWGTPKGIGAF